MRIAVEGDKILLYKLLVLLFFKFIFHLQFSHNFAKNLDEEQIFIILISGCLHGELDIVYNTIKFIEQQHSTKIDLLLICGDFQAVRNEADLKCMAMPPKYRAMQQFWKYYKVRNVTYGATIA